LRLLKNAESNADAKNLELEDLYVKNIVVQQAPVRKRIRLSDYALIFKWTRKLAVVLTVPTVASIPTKVTPAILRFVFPLLYIYHWLIIFRYRLFLQLQTRKSNGAKIKMRLQQGRSAKA
jgi:Ribosomal protein L22p/L17e